MEHCFTKLKQFHRIATRNDKFAASSHDQPASMRQWLQPPFANGSIATLHVWHDLQFSEGWEKQAASTLDGF